MQSVDDVRFFIHPVVDQYRSYAQAGRTPVLLTTGLPMYGKVFSMSKWLSIALAKRSVTSGNVA